LQDADLNAPKCTHTRHAWKRHGGIPENPCVYGIGGSAVSVTGTDAASTVTSSALQGGVVDPPTPNRDRQQSFRIRQERAGLRRVEVWVPEGTQERLRQFAALLCQETKK
jgi:hypothetical protein